MTGTSVLGIKYKVGIMIAADNLSASSYLYCLSSSSLTYLSMVLGGALAPFKDIQGKYPVELQVLQYLSILS